MGTRGIKAILDTNLLVSESLSHPGFEVAVTSLSWAELGYEVRATSEPAERARRETRIARLRAYLGRGIPFDDDATDAYEAICGLVLANDREVRGRAIDLMIAAIAVAHGAAVITRDADDFSGLDGLVTVIAA